MVDFSDKAGVLLIFPPSAPWQKMPEMGIFQLGDILRRHGIPAQCLDLNTALHQEWLDRPDVLGSLTSFLRREASRRNLRNLTPLDWLSLVVSSEWPADRVVEILARKRGTRIPQHRALYQPSYSTDPEPLFVGVPGLTFEDLCKSYPLFRILLGEALHYFHWQPRTTLADDVFDFSYRRIFLLDDYYDDLLRELGRKRAPLFVGFSLWTTSQVGPALRLARLLKEMWPRTPMIAGGPWCSSAMTLLPTIPDLFDFFDAVVLGHADRVIVALAMAAQEARCFCGLPNTVVRKNGKVVLPSLIERIPLIEEVPPTYEDVPLDLYPERRLPLRIHDGCPWGRCLYCHHVLPGFTNLGPDNDDGSLVQRGLDEAVRLVQDRAVRLFYISDHAVPFERLVSFASGLLERKVQCRWDAMARFDPDCTVEGVRTIVASGCEQLQVGLETTDPTALARFRKGIAIGDDVEPYLKIASECGLPVLVFLMTFPGQTREMLERDIEWVLAHSDHISRVYLQHFRLHRGSYAFLHPEEVGIEIVGDVSRNLNVEEVPYRADIVSEEEATEAALRVRVEIARRHGYHLMDPLSHVMLADGPQLVRVLERILGPSVRGDGVQIGPLRVLVRSVEMHQVSLAVVDGEREVGLVGIRSRDDSKEAVARTARLDLYYYPCQAATVEELLSVIRCLAEQLD